MSDLCFICNPHIPDLDGTCSECNRRCWEHVKEAYELMGVIEDE